MKLNDIYVEREKEYMGKDQTGVFAFCLFKNLKTTKDILLPSQYSPNLFEEICDLNHWPCHRLRLNCFSVSLTYVELANHEEER